jgi:hypothetical protein
MRKTKREEAILAVLADGRVGKWTNFNAANKDYSGNGSADFLIQRNCVFHIQSM